MWFDVQAALAEIGGRQEPVRDARPPATSAAPATNPAHVASVASVATPETFPHGVSVTGSPRTWTGRVVSLAEWRRLTEWQRNGSRGQHWCGIARDWSDPKAE